MLKVTTKTSDIMNAGTDANVWIKLFGDAGDSGDLKLSKSETNVNKFERNKEDVFHLSAPFVGKVNLIFIVLYVKFYSFYRKPGDTFVDSLLLQYMSLDDIIILYYIVSYHISYYIILYYITLHYIILYYICDHNK